MLPVRVDPETARDRLSIEERRHQAELAALEERLRHFDDVDRVAYERWLRLELGPALETLESRREELRARQALAQRLAELVDVEGWPPREALYLVLNPFPEPPPRRDRMDPAAVEARRRAKRERKRAERKAARRAERTAVAREPASRRDARPSTGALGLYRALARRLHPDSPTVVRSLDPLRVRAVWADVQAAYGAGDAERLLSIAVWLDGAAGAVDGEPSRSLAEGYERLRSLARSRRKLEARLSRVVSDPAWEFSRCSDRDRRRLRQEAEQAIDDELSGVDGALGELAELFDSIGRPRPPRGGSGRRPAPRLP